MIFDKAEEVSISHFKQSFNKQDPIHLKTI